MKSSAKKVELAPYDDLFSPEESRQDAKLEKVREIPLFYFFEKGQIKSRIEGDFLFIDHIQQFGNQLRQADIALHLVPTRTSLLRQQFICTQLRPKLGRS